MTETELTAVKSESERAEHYRALWLKADTENKEMRDALQFMQSNYATTDYPSDQIAQERMAKALLPAK